MLAFKQRRGRIHDVRYIGYYFPVSNGFTSITRSILYYVWWAGTVGTGKIYTEGG